MMADEFEVSFKSLLIGRCRRDLALHAPNQFKGQAQMDRRLHCWLSHEHLMTDSIQSSRHSRHSRHNNACMRARSTNKQESQAIHQIQAIMSAPMRRLTVLIQDIVCFSPWTLLLIEQYSSNNTQLSALPQQYCSKYYQ